MPFPQLSTLKALQPEDKPIMSSSKHCKLLAGQIDQMNDDIRNLSHDTTRNDSNWNQRRGYPQSPPPRKSNRNEWCNSLSSHRNSHSQVHLINTFGSHDNGLPVGISSSREHRRTRGMQRWVVEPDQCSYKSEVFSSKKNDMGFIGLTKNTDTSDDKNELLPSQVQDHTEESKNGEKTTNGVEENEVIVDLTGDTDASDDENSFLSATHMNFDQSPPITSSSDPYGAYKEVAESIMASLEPSEWLVDEGINVIFNILRYQKDFSGSTSCLLLPTYFSQRLLGENEMKDKEKWCNDIVEKYKSKTSSLNECKTWVIPVNSEGRHWFLLVADWINYRIHIHDSSRRNETVQKLKMK